MIKKPGSRGKRGRPHVESKKIRYQVMLDPRYIKHTTAFSKNQDMTLQDLFRFALISVIPDPFSAIPVSLEQVSALREKAIAFAETKTRGRKPSP